MHVFFHYLWFQQVTLGCSISGTAHCFDAAAPHYHNTGEVKCSLGSVCFSPVCVTVSSPHGAVLLIGHMVWSHNEVQPHCLVFHWWASYFKCFKKFLMFCARSLVDPGWRRMQPTQAHVSVFSALLLLLCLFSFSAACNKALCASDVSKCLIQVSVAITHIHCVCFTAALVSFSLRVGPVRPHFWDCG